MPGRVNGRSLQCCAGAESEEMGTEFKERERTSMWCLGYGGVLDISSLVLG